MASTSWSCSVVRMPEPRARMLQAVGMALSAAGLIAILWNIARNDIPQGLVPKSASDWRELVSMTALMSGASVLVALAWLSLLRPLVPAMNAPIWILGVYMVTQLSKFLPGNIFQYVSRQAMLSRAHISLLSFVESAVAEAVCLAGVAGLIVLMVGATVGFEWRPPIWVLAVGGLTVIALLAVAFAARKLLGSALQRLPLARREALPFVIVAVAADAIFFAGMAKVVGNLAAHVAPTNPPVHFATLIGATALAWVVGFIVPGAPAGLGVREGALLVLLSSQLGAATGAIVASFRLITTFADVVQAAIGAMIVFYFGPPKD